MTELDELFYQCSLYAMITHEDEEQSIKALLRMLYEKHRDKTFDLIEGFEMLYGLMMLATISGYRLGFKGLNGTHMYKANKHYQKVLGANR